VHTAEGPAIDPFFLVPARGAAPFVWAVRTILDGPAELLAAAGDGSAGLYAWVRPTDPHGNRRRRAIVLYRSRDGGRRWSPEADEGIPGRLPRITARSGRWRIVDRPDGGFDVQRLDARGWAVIRQFPWSACPAG